MFAIPAKFVAGSLIECDDKQIADAVLILSGYAETGVLAPPGNDHIG